MSVSYDIAVDHNKENSPPPPVSDVETLVLSHFSHPPRLDFGSVKAKQIKRCQLNIRNPNDVELDVKVEKFPHKKGFSAESLDFVVEPLETYPLYIDWVPDGPGNFREMVLCHVGGAFRVQAYLLGKCPEPPKPKKPVSKTIKSLRKPANTIGRPQNKPGGRTSLAPNESKGKKDANRVSTGTGPVVKNSVRQPLHPKVQNKDNVGRNQNQGQNAGPKKTCNDHILSKVIKGNQLDPRMTMRLSKPTVLPPEREETVETKQEEEVHHLLETYIQETTETRSEEVMVQDVRAEVYTGRSGVNRGGRFEQKHGYERPKTFAEMPRNLTGATHRETYVATATSTMETHSGGRCMDGIGNKNNKSDTLLGDAIGMKGHRTFTTSLPAGVEIGDHDIDYEEVVEEVVEYVEECMEEVEETEYIVEQYVTQKGSEKDIQVLSETVVLDDRHQSSCVTSSVYHSSSVRTLKTDLTTNLTTDLKGGHAMATAAKQLTPDDPNFPDTPSRRVTFIKDDPQLPDTPSRRVTFKKDDPAMPLTPVRRDTYLKPQNHLSNTPVICSPDSLNSCGGSGLSSPRSTGRMRMGVSSLTPKRKDTRSASPPKERQSLRFSDDSQIHRYKDGEMTMDSVEGNLTPLSRYGTYTKLNGSISPRPVAAMTDHSPATTYSIIDDLDDFELPCPVENPQPMGSNKKKNKQKKLSIISERSEKSERRSILSMDSLDDEQSKIDEEELEGRENPYREREKRVISLQSSPTGSKYATAYTTPYESPGLSDTENFEDSVAYQHEESPGGANATVMENSQLMASILRDKLERVASFDGGTPTNDCVGNSFSIKAGVLDYGQAKDTNDSIASLISMPKSMEPVPEFTDDDGIEDLSEEESDDNNVIKGIIKEDRNEQKDKEMVITEDVGESVEMVGGGRLEDHVVSSKQEANERDKTEVMHDSFSLLKTPGIKPLPPVPVFEDCMPAAAEDDETISRRLTVLPPRQSSTYNCPRSPSMYGNPFNDTGLEVSTLGFENETFLQREKMNLKDYGPDLRYPGRGARRTTMGQGLISWQDNLNKVAFEEQDPIPGPRFSNKTTVIIHDTEDISTDDLVVPESVTEPESGIDPNLLLKTPQTKVQAEIKQRCSSTPYHRDADRQREEFDTEDSPTHFSKTPSPIIGERVSRDTVTKPRASAALVHADLGTGPHGGSGRQVKKGLVYTGDGSPTEERETVVMGGQEATEETSVRIKCLATKARNDDTGFMETTRESQLSEMLDATYQKDATAADPRRFSSLTVTKSKPTTELSQKGVVDRETLSNRKLFDGGDDNNMGSDGHGRSRLQNGPENQAKVNKWKQNKADITYKVQPNGGQDCERVSVEETTKPLAFQIDASDCKVTTNNQEGEDKVYLNKGQARWSKAGQMGARDLKDRREKTRANGEKDMKSRRSVQRGSARQKVVGVEEQDCSSSMAEVSPQKREHSVDQSGVRKKLRRSEQISRPARQTVASRLSASSALNEKKSSKPASLRKQTALGNMVRSAQQKSQGNTTKKATGTGRVVAKTKLTLVRQQKTSQALPKHPLAFAAKNVYYDERWMEKEEKGFVKWLNFILTPPDFYFDARKPKKIDAGKLFLTDIHNTLTKAPTKEALSFRAYCARRKLNGLRRAACRLYQGELLVGVQSRLEREIMCKRLAVRTDRMLFADLGLKQKILEMLLSYNPLWLRIGLETIYGEVVHLQSPTDVMGLSQFIAHRFLGNPDISAEFAHPTVPHLYRDGYYESLGQFTLKKFLMLVMFVDHAKRSRLITEDPCLFCKDADFKSSKAVLLSFSRDFLSGEGDLVKHLTYLGYKVAHTQTPLEEADYSVSNLATDLRDGIRLTRVVSLLTSDWSLLSGLRCPAISILQKVHNVGVSLTALTDRSVDLHTARGGKILARDIVDGHREKTLQLLWRIIFNFQVDQVIDEVKLRQEVTFLKNSLSTKKQQEALLCDLDPQALGLPREARDSVDPSDIYYKSEKLYLLLRWCRAVCAHYNVKVENFTVSFSDGRVLCYLLHYYHPELLPRQRINTETTQTQSGDADLSLNSDDSFTDGLSYADVNSKVNEQLLKNERENFKTLYEKVSELGGVPLMLRASDMSATIPDEKVVITYVSCLCARLLDIRRETQAARRIQHAWRRHRLGAGRTRLKERHEAARTIQRHVRPFLERRQEQRQQQAAVILQRCYRGYRVRRSLEEARGRAESERRANMVVIIQACVRGHLTRVHMRERHLAAVLIQSAYRGWTERRRYSSLKRTVIGLQRRWRDNRLCRAEVERFSLVRRSVITLQSRVRMWLKHRRVRQHRAASTIQAYYRMIQTRHQYRRQLAGVIILQSHNRAWLAKRRYKQLCSSALVLQARYRAILEGRKQRQAYMQIKDACICLQKYTRGSMARNCVKRIRAVVQIQAAARGRIQREKYSALRKAAIVIQRRYRSAMQGREMAREYKATKRSIVTVQACVRGYLVRQKVKRVKAAVVTLQKHYRGHMQREKMKKIQEASGKIQKWYRGCLAMREQRRMYLASVRAIVTIQSWFKMIRARAEYLRIRGLVVKMQALSRRNKAIREYRRQKNAALVIQRRFRAREEMKTAKAEFHKTREAVVTLQSFIRRSQQRARFVHVRTVVVKMQALMRAKIERKKYVQAKKAAETIQGYFRGYLAMRDQRKQYVTLRENAIKLQSLVRMKQNRLNYLKVRKAVTLIQSLVRARLERKRYVQVKQSAKTIQKYYRGYLAMKTQRQSYLYLRKNTIKLQSLVRMKQSRMRYLKLRESVILIQSLLRAKKARAAFLRKKSAVTSIQRAWRAFYIVSVNEQMDLRVTRAATSIQAVVRGYLVRKRLETLKRGVVKLQALVRARQGQRRFIQYKYAIYEIQGWWRATLVARRERGKFVRIRQGIVGIQTCYRGLKARVEYRCLRRGFVRLQAVWRMRLQQRKYRRLRESVVSIQKKLRATLQARVQRSMYLHYRRCATTLQAAVRGYSQRQNYHIMRTGFTRLQALCRMRKEKKTYREMKRAAMTVQQGWRALKLGKTCREEFQKKRKAVVIIQARLKGLRERSKYLATRTGVIRLQALYRMRKDRQNYKKLKEATGFVQQRWRALKKGQTCRQEFQKTCKAAIVLQAGFKGLLERKRYLTARAGVIRLQGLVKGVLQRKALLRLRAAVIVMQYRVRAALVARRQRNVHLKMRRAAVQIQSCHRCALARRRYLTMKQGFTKLQVLYRSRLLQREYEQKRNAACKIQQWWRSVMLRAKAEREYMVLRGKVIIVQRAVRGFLYRKRRKTLINGVVRLQALYRARLQRRQFVSFRTAALIVQTRWRATRLANKEKAEYVQVREAIVQLQSVVKGLKQRREYMLMRRSTVIIQSIWKRVLQRRRYVKVLTAAKCIQSHWRARSEGKKVQAHYQRQLNAVSCIQRYFRRLQRSMHQQRSRAAVILQTCWRGYRQRCVYRNVQAQRALRRQAATVILQHHIWKHVLRRRAIKALRQKVDCVIKLQALTRGFLARKRLNEIKSAICIQAAVRGFLARRQTIRTKSDIVHCQSLVRMWQCRRQFVKSRKAALTLQRYWRARVVGRQVRESLAQRYNKAIVIQAYYRRHLAQTRYRRMRTGFVKLQRLGRKFLYRKHYERARGAAVIVQRWWRRKQEGQIVRREYIKKVRSTRVLQTHVRRFLVRRRSLRTAAMTIQAVWRGHLLRSRLSKLSMVVTRIQRRFRECRQELREKREGRAVVKIQAVVRGYVARSEYTRLRRAVLLAQSLWRGRCVRVSVGDGRVAAARARVQKAAAQATEERTLAHRTVSALDFLLRCKKLDTVMRALIDLDVVTKLLPECCERLVEANAVHVLYQVILGANRSIPHQELIRYAVSTLLNLAKYDKTAFAVYDGVESVSLLLDVMTIYRDKKCLLFPQLCTLLGIIGHHSQVVQDVEAIPRFCEKLRSIQTLVARKHKMEANRQKAAARMAAMKSFNCTLPLLAPAAKKRSRVKPEWVLKKGNLSHIKDPLEAIDFVLETFSVNPK